VLTAYNRDGKLVTPGQLLTGRDGASYEYVEIVCAPTATSFGRVRVRKIHGAASLWYAAQHDAGLTPRYSSQTFADIAFGLTIR